MFFVLRGRGRGAIHCIFSFYVEKVIYKTLNAFFSKVGVFKAELSKFSAPWIMNKMFFVSFHRECYIIPPSMLISILPNLTKLSLLLNKKVYFVRKWVCKHHVHVISTYKRWVISSQFFQWIQRMFAAHWVRCLSAVFPILEMLKASQGVERVLWV